MENTPVWQPPFTRGKKQLERMEVDSRELSIVRIHLERIVGVLKQKFTFYETLYQYQIIVTATLSTIDKIVCVCLVH